MTSPNDWRFDLLKRYRGAIFRKAKYERLTDDWDHDHCEGCFAKFGDVQGPEILREGYVSAHPYDGSPAPEFITKLRDQGKRRVPAPIVDGCTIIWSLYRGMKLPGLGIDLAKNVLDLVGLDSSGQVVIRKRCSRRKLINCVMGCDSRWRQGP
jgi:hypothetical protein